MPGGQVKHVMRGQDARESPSSKADDGRWEGNGDKMDFHADLKTGQITHEEPDD
jgi:hypothetical protein